MVSAAYDHLVAIVVVGLIFVMTVAALPFSGLQTVDQQQLRNTAYNVFDSMLLDVGSSRIGGQDVSKWGSIVHYDASNNPYFDPNEVMKFGLAFSEPFSKFVLDPDKVQRLNEGEMSYTRVRGLLNLQNDYGFRLSIARPFRTAHTLNITDTTVQFSVTVTRTEDGTPIPNANVTVTTYVTARYKDAKYPKGTPLPANITEYISAPIPPIHGTTDVKGNFQGIQNVSLGQYMVDSAVAIMEVAVAGLKTTVVAQNDYMFCPYINMTTYGDKIILSIRGSLLEDQPNERKIMDAQAYDSQSLLDLLDDPSKITWGTGHENATLDVPGISAIHPSVLFMVLEVKLNAQTLPNGTNIPGGKRWVLVAGPFSFADSEKIYDFGGSLVGINIIATMRRLCVISDMTYIVSISFWREHN